MITRLAGLVPARLKQSLPYRAVRSAYLFRDTDAYRHLRQRVRGGQEKRVANYLAASATPRPQIGCGANPLDGWLNTDYFPDEKPGGRLRISTPSMEALIEVYQDPLKPAHAAYIDYHRDHWFTGPLATPAMLFNNFYRNWGHLTIYDEATLRASLERAGFVSIAPVTLGESSVEALRGMENEKRMPAGLLKLHTLAFEAEKPR